MSETAIEVIGARIKTVRIKEALEAKHITQEECARRVGISYRHMNRCVLGKSAPSLLLAERLSAVLGRPIHDLFIVTIATRRRITKRRRTIRAAAA